MFELDKTVFGVPPNIEELLVFSGTGVDKLLNEKLVFPWTEDNPNEREGVTVTLIEAVRVVDILVATEFWETVVILFPGKKLMLEDVVLNKEGIWGLVELPKEKFSCLLFDVLPNENGLFVEAVSYKKINF